MHKLRSIQVLRAVAACAVVVLHAASDVHRPVGNAGFGAAGVDLFFVISGFIMANVSQGRTAGQFLGERLWRIYPMWWVAVLPWLFLVPRGLTFIVSSLTLWPVYSDGYYVPVLQVGWTLSFELLFYFGMAFALRTRAWLPLASYALLLAGALSTPNALLHFLGNPIALEFALGIIVAKLPRRAIFGFAALIGIALIAATSPNVGSAKGTLDPEFALWRVSQWGLPAALIVWGALSMETLFERRLFDVPVAIGDASYSIYLFHPLVAYGSDLSWPAGLLLAVGVGCAIHVLVERRLMAARRTWPATWLSLRTRFTEQVKAA